MKNLKNPIQHLTAGLGPPPWLVPGSLKDVPGPDKNHEIIYLHSIYNSNLQY